MKIKKKSRQVNKQSTTTTTPVCHYLSIPYGLRKKLSNPLDDEKLLIKLLERIAGNKILMGGVKKYFR